MAARPRSTSRRARLESGDESQSIAAMPDVGSPPDADTIRRTIGYNDGMPDAIEVYIETTDKRTFAGAVAWPGWARSGRTADEALANLATYRDRYAAALRE